MLIIHTKGIVILTHPRYRIVLIITRYRFIVTGHAIRKLLYMIPVYVNNTHHVTLMCLTCRRQANIHYFVRKGFTEYRMKDPTI